MFVVGSPQCADDVVDKEDDTEHSADNREYQAEVHFQQSNIV